MAVTVARTQLPIVPGAQRMTCSDVTLDSAYQASGEPLTAADLGLSTVDFAVSSVKSTTSASGVVNASYIPATNLIRAYTATAEVAGAVDCSAVVVTVLAFGK